MELVKTNLNIVELTPENIQQETFYCIKDVSKPGSKAKENWFKKRCDDGLKIKILKDEKQSMIGFIEYVPAQYAWRPIEALDFMFIHCMIVYPKKNKHMGYGSLLIDICEKEAKTLGLKGLCVMTSKGSWITDAGIFLKNGFQQTDKKDRFELLVKKWDESAVDPEFLDWTSQQKKYMGWHLLYANQCPWHEKSVNAIKSVAAECAIELKTAKIKSSKEAKKSPSGFGVFSLLHNGKLLEDHYISEGRFRNILKKELEHN